MTNTIYFPMKTKTPCFDAKHELGKINSAKKERVHTSKRNKIHIFAWIPIKVLTQPWVSIVHNQAVGKYCSQSSSATSQLVRYHAAPVQKHENHMTTHYVCNVDRKLKN